MQVFKDASRIEKKEGIYFYEKDLVEISYQMTGDAEFEMEVDYLQSGVGIVLAETRQGELTTETLFIKLGVNSLSLYETKHSQTKRINFTSCSFEPVITKAKLRFIKANGRFEVMYNNKSLGSYLLPSDYANYKVYIYSNAGNSVRSLLVRNIVPADWVTNIENTGGGRVLFTKDRIQFENCQKEAEVEQYGIRLKAGTYYLSYLLEYGEVEPVVFLASNKKMKDSQKNLLVNDSFSLEKDETIHLKLKGKNVAIKELSIKSNREDAYVSTIGDQRGSKGSHIDLLIDHIEKATWQGVITELSPASYSLFETSEKIYGLADGNVLLNREYSYTFSRDDMTIKVSDNSQSNIVKIIAAKDEQYIRLFKNMNASITNLVVTTSDGQEIHINAQQTVKGFVPGVVKGPILCLNKETRAPYDLSSSYRQEKTSGSYLFTNWAREYFTRDSVLKLSKQARTDSSDIIVYGVIGGYDLNNFYLINKDIHDIDYFAPNHEVVLAADYSLDLDGISLVVNASVWSKYKVIVVEYLKENSYCINKNKSLGMYEVDISGENSVELIYDYGEEKQNIFQFGNTNQYVVFGGGSFENT